MTKINLQVENISCDHCVNTIEMELSEIEGVDTVIANSETKTVEVSFSAPATDEMIIDLLAEINYPATI
jgi:copper ion binding protein